MKLGRMLMLAFAIEAVAILALVLLVWLFGPPDPAAARAYAEQLGYWFGPIAGFVFCVLGGWFVARNLSSRHVPRGLLLGSLVAAIDIALIVAGGAAFQAIFVFSNFGRLVAGSLGGWLASKT